MQYEPLVQPNSDEAEWQALLEEAAPPPTLAPVLGWLLFALLLFQATLAWQASLSQNLPAFGQALRYACDLLGCKPVEAPDASAIRITGSNLESPDTNPNVMRLTITLQNTLPRAQRMPTLELTLTDSLNRIVLKRLIFPGDLKPAPQKLEPQHSTPVQVHFEWQGLPGHNNDAAPGATGYTVRPVYL